MREEETPTIQLEKPVVTELPAKGGEERVVELERLVRAMEVHVAELKAENKQLRTDRRELSALNEKLRDPTNVEELEHLAFTDELTGVFSRRGFERQAKLAITHQVERLRDLKRPEMSERRQEAKNQETLSFIMLDLDLFKKINDTYGHDAGDGALRKVGEVLHNSIRGDDFCGRWGGEEFLVCIRSPDQNISRQVAERMRMAIAKIVFSIEATRIPLTASFGIANWQDGDTLDDTVRRADGALYVAKNAGRNQVVDEKQVDGKSFYKIDQSEDLIPKEKIQEFLGSKESK